MKKHFFISLLGAIFGFLITYYIVLGEVETKLNSFQVFLSVSAGIVIAYSIFFSTKFLDKYISRHLQEANRLLIGILLHFAIAFLMAYFFVYLYDKFFTKTLNFSENYKQVFIKLAIILFIVMVIFEVIYFALYSYYAYTTLQIKSIQQERKQIELQFQVLKSQLSPHFLFNSLNIISSLIFKDKNTAEKFIRTLAKMYQYTLKSYSTKLITLKEELDFVNSYLFLLKTRFDSKFSCSIDFPDNILEKKLPPLALQLLIENAIKHNKMGENNPLKIKVFTDQKNIIVQNNITEPVTNVSSFNIGLKNINSRYLLLDHKGIIVSNGDNFTVKIPII